MTTLFIDTTYNVSLGLLSEQRKWIDLRNFHGQKSSIILQPEVFKLISDNNLNIQSLTNIVSIAGPGFYTGLRLSEGFCDVFKFFKIPHFSFYSYEIPLWSGVISGGWMTKAYRGEYFLHTWKEGVRRNEMVSVSDLPLRMSEFDKLFIHSEEALDELSLRNLKQYESTSELLKLNPSLVFDQVFSQKLQRESFYFRPPEDEFKVNP